MGARRGRGPDQRRRRQRPGKIRGSAAEEQVRACLERGGTLEEAARVYRDNAGHCVSINSVSRYARAVRREREEKERHGELVTALAQAHGLPLRSQMRQLLQAHVLAAVAGLPEQAFQGISGERLVLALARLDRMRR